MKVIADQDLCMASLQCTAVAPEIFDNDEDGVVIVRQELVSGAAQEAAEYAVRICPAAAIRLAQQ